jgi:hypothetical protein
MLTTSALKASDVIIYPCMGLDAIHTKHGGAWRLWLLCRFLDREGRGAIRTTKLRQAANDLKLSRQLYKSWLDDALGLGIISLDATESIFYLKGVASAAKLLGVTQLGNHVIVKNYKRLFRKGWKALVWGGYLLSGRQSPRSQNSRHEQTLVTPRTQRRYERQIKIKRISNITQVNHNRTYFNGLIECDNRVIFERDGNLFQRLPTTRIVQKYNFAVAKRGRSYKERKQLRALFNKTGGAKPNTSNKLFFENEKSAQSAVKSWRRSDDYERPIEVFYHIRYENVGRLQANNTWQSLTV